MTSLEGYTALVIEDDDTSANVITFMLEDLGVGVTILKDYEVEESLASVAIPHVIFCDLEMPSMTGYEVQNYIRQFDDFNAVPIIAYTTHISHMHESRLAGFDGFLGKPLDVDAFPDQLVRILNGEAVWETH